MSEIPNDDFDMCCGNRPRIEDLTGYPLILWKYRASCGICGNFESGDTLSELMIDWNLRQRERA